MTNEMVFLAIFKGEKMTVCIEYKPMPDGLIEIVSVDIEARPVSPFQIREQERRKPRRGLVLDEQEERVEAMLPTTRIEQMNLFK